MQSGTPLKAYLPVVGVLLGTSLVLTVLRYFIPGSGIDFKVLHFGNLLLFLVGCISLRMSTRALTDKNVQVFLRLVYGSFMMKFFVFATVAFVYIFTYKKNINKPALLGCLALYILYTFFEIRTVLKQAKRKNA
jgi:hypothetical protein